MALTREYKISFASVIMQWCIANTDDNIHLAISCIYLPNSNVIFVTIKQYGEPIKNADFEVDLNNLTEARVHEIMKHTEDLLNSIRK